MNYYEELGLESSASPEEIRRAYRKLAQLLHPDQYQDEALRRVCERQLARLNGIAETLEDPTSRNEYDALLLEQGRIVAAAPSRLDQVREFLSSLSLATWVWLAAAVVGIALMALLFRWNAASAGETPYRADSAPEDTHAKQARPTRAPAPAPARAFHNRPAPQPRPTPAAPAIAEARPSYNAPSEPVPAATPSPVPEPPRALPVISQPPPTPAPTPTPRPPHSYFAGRWFFSHDVAERDRALYPPEMIELAITEDNGILRGSYRARYRVTDRPVSPDVSFQFLGPANKPETAELSWTGPGGAEGRVRLHAVTPVSMEVNWWATRLGSLGLVSGTAILIRGDEQ